MAAMAGGVVHVGNCVHSSRHRNNKTDLRVTATVSCSAKCDVATLRHQCRRSVAWQFTHSIHRIVLTRPSINNNRAGKPCSLAPGRGQPQPESDEDGPITFDMSGLSDDSEDEDTCASSRLQADTGANGPAMKKQGKGAKKADSAGPAGAPHATPGRKSKGRGRRTSREDDAERAWFEAAEQEILAAEQAGADFTAPPQRRKATAAGADANAEESGAAPALVPKSRRTSANLAAEDERDVFYQGLLTQADSDADPPGHVSGFVAIIGRPNAGKSTLLNALVGQKLSIVSHRVQTTRHRILGIVSGPEYQAVLVDTPGVILEQRNKLEGRMMTSVKRAMKEADAIVAIIDASHSPEEVLGMIQPPPNAQTPPMCVVLNKEDLLSPEQLDEIRNFFQEKCRCDVVLTTCAKSGGGVTAVREWMVSKLPLGPTLYPKGLVSEHPERFFVSEIIREHVYHQYADEIPYSVQVNVTEFKERGEGQKDYVSCDLICERDSQKGILIGNRGSALKALSTAARAEIEQFLGRPVYLDLSVRAQKGWREDVDLLKKFGY